MPGEEENGSHHGREKKIYSNFQAAGSGGIVKPKLHPGPVTRPNEVWVADITYIRILTGFFYLAVILDLFSRKVIGWALFTVPIQSSL